MDNMNEELHVEQETVEVEETTTEATEDNQEEQPQDETVVVSKEKFKAMQMKAIAFDKQKKTPPQQPLPNSNNFLTREEGILIAKGMDDDTINQLKVIAKGKGISLLEAEKDPLFVPYLEKVQKEKKSEQAKLGASKGSNFKQEKAEAKSGMSREEHMNLWKGKA